MGSPSVRPSLAAVALAIWIAGMAAACSDEHPGGGAPVATAPPAAAPVDHAAVTAAAAAAGPLACAECHRTLHPQLVQAHEAGPHAAKVSCADCHGTDHKVIFSTRGEVSSARCGTCHAARYAEFKRSKHGRLLKEGAMADTLVAHAAAVGGCQATNGCHEVQRQNADGSIGRCTSCHMSHASHRGAASDPAVCSPCHSGPDHPQWEAWSNGRHGILWRQDPASLNAPSCATCHMPAGSHVDGTGLTASVAAQVGGRDPTLVPLISHDAHDAARTSMVAVCAKCHGERLARQTLGAADETRSDALALCEEAAQVVRDLDEEQLLVPAPKDRPKNPVSDGGLVLGGKQIYDVHSSRAERLFYDMFMFDFPRLWRAAYHTEPNFVRWTQREQLKTDLIEIRAEAERLRAAKRPPSK